MTTFEEAIDRFNLSVYSSEEARQNSVKEIKIDSGISSLRHVIDNGIYDLSMGTLHSLPEEACRTCQQKSPYCPGHCGHIELYFPVINAVFWDDIPKLLSRICVKCYAYGIKYEEIIIFDCQRKLLKAGYPLESLDVPIISSSLTLDNDEVEEVLLNTDGTELPLQSNLQSRLSTFVKKIKKVKEPATDPTAHSMAIEDEIVRSFNNNKMNICSFCNSYLLSVVYVNCQLVITNWDKCDQREQSDDLKNLNNGWKIITPEEARSILRKCWSANPRALSCLYPFLAEKDTEHPTDLFFISTLLVIPTQMRPFEFLGDIVREADINLVYKEIIRIIRSLRLLAYYRDADEEKRSKIPKHMVALMNLYSGDTWQEKVHLAWAGLQKAVNSIWDAAYATNKLAKGIRQRIEKKEGLLRSNLMGKRVNFSARSLAAPDPCLNVDEIGVPRDFAKFLTYPVPVTHSNVANLRKLVINGNSKYPGANYLEFENGSVVNLEVLNKAKRIAYAKTLITPDNNAGKRVNSRKIVYRHLIDGDIVLMNRQPTLHKPSIQAHKARVTIDDRVLRMPYANCKAYNADFDGDEINLHFIQSELARCESATIVATHNNYLTPKDGSPLAGLIQDCVVAAVKMTVRGKFFGERHYTQLVSNALWNHPRAIRLMRPAILKPRKLWSGKQIISTIMLNIIPADTHKPTFSFKTAVKCDNWQTQPERAWNGGGTKEKTKESMTESEWIMRSGELLCGIVDKCAIGSTSYGLIHVCYDLYGGTLAVKLLSAINRLCLSIMPALGHTIGLVDFTTPRIISDQRRESTDKMINNAIDLVAQKVAKSKESMQSYIKDSHLRRKEKHIKLIESSYKTSFDAGSISRDNERALYRRSLDNNMKMMVDTGAKGSKINLNQMASIFGELTIDGKRIQMRAGGKTLPAFQPHDPNPLAGGYIKSRYITGMDCKSVVFLSMAGRDSLQHTAVKTANSGYMQRCLMKHCEGITVRCDKTVRNSDNMVLQFEYGEDGQDVCKMPFLKNYHGFDVIADNYTQIMDNIAKAKAQSMSLNNEAVSKYKRQAVKSLATAKKQGLYGFRAFYEANKHIDVSSDINPLSGRSFKCEQIQKDWYSLNEEEKMEWDKKAKSPDPAASVFRNGTCSAAVSESLDKLIDKYYKEKYSRRNTYEAQLSKHSLRESLYMKTLNSKVESGHPVGALCAQSIGEPLTQMTLNTFHLAGQDDLNITLGVPRMIEILKTASANISTPYMQVPFLPEITEQQAETVRCKLTRVPFEDVVSTLTVMREDVPPETKRDVRQVEITIEIRLRDRKYCKKAFNLDLKTMQRFAETSFLDQLDAAICSASFNVAVRGSMQDMKTRVGLASTRPSKVEEEISDVEEEDHIDTPNDSDEQDNDHRRTYNKQKEYSDEEMSDAEENSVQENDMKNQENVDTEVGSVYVQKKFINKVQFFKGDVNCIKYTALMPLSIYQLLIMAQVVKNAIVKASVRSVKNINQSFVGKNDNGLTLKTDGVNFNEILKYRQYLDVNKFYTNNIITMSEMYGIESALTAIIMEIRTVQNAYNITVDFRHLSLLAHYFTCEGKYKACSRHALRSCASQMQCFTFETATSVMKDALIRAKKDYMHSPSSNVLIGAPVKLGSNSMKVFANTKAMSIEHNNRIFSHMY